MTWKDGYRVVDLYALAKQMYCKQCRSILDLNGTKEEEKIGFASVLTIVCSCGARNAVHTAVRCNTDSGDAAYAINLKAATSNATFNVVLNRFHMSCS